MNKIDNHGDKEKSEREKEKRKIRAFYILTGLVFTGILFLLSLYAFLTGQGSLLWDVALGSFAGLSAAALYSGVIFPVFAIIALPLLPIIFFYYYWKFFKK